MNDKIIKMIENILSNIKYGSITLVIQDGKIYQVESNSKVRVK